MVWQYCNTLLKNLVGYGGSIFLHLSAALPPVHFVDHPNSGWGDAVDEHGDVLSRPQFLPRYALPQLGHQPDPLQRHVIQIPHSFPQSAGIDVGGGRAAPPPEAAPSPPQPPVDFQHDDHPDGHLRLCQRKRRWSKSSSIRRRRTEGAHPSSHQRSSSRYNFNSINFNYN